MTQLLCDICGRVSCQGMQEIVTASGMSYYKLAQRLGWERKLKGRPSPDATRVKDALGLKNGRRGRTHLTMDLDIAIRILRACNIDPVDVGL